MPMLKKMKMPKREEISMEELDSEMPEDMPAEGGEGEEVSSADEGKMADLAAISDEDLMAEMKKRGLMGEMADEDMDMAESGEQDLENEDEMYA